MYCSVQTAEKRRDGAGDGYGDVGLGLEGGRKGGVVMFDSWFLALVSLRVLTRERGISVC